MNSKDFIFNALDLPRTSSILFDDKETQTSVIQLVNSISSFKSSSRPVPRNIDTSSKNENVKSFEFCEVIQDPDDEDSITIIKETFTEEVINDSDRSLFPKPSKNKFKYCKEIIQPYSKKIPNPDPDCPSFPKNKCCKPITENQSVPDRSIKSNPPSSSSTEEVCIADIKGDMDSNKSKSTFVNPDTSQCDPCKKKEKNYSSCCSISSIKNAKSPCEPAKPAEPECPKQNVDECILKKCISACISESLKLAKKGSSACVGKFERVIGVKQPKECNEKPTYYEMKKPKSKESTEVCPKSSIQSIIETQTKAVATITCAIKDLFGRVYNKTKDCVNLIKSESCKHVGKEEECNSNKPPKCESKTKVCSSNPSGTSTKTLFDRIRGQTSKSEDNKTYSVETTIKDNILEPAKEVMEHVASVVSSTVSVIKNNSFEKIANDILTDKFNKSSPYDQPKIGSTPPKQVAQDHEPTTDSMFVLIKNKLLSIFSGTNQTMYDEDGDSEDDDDQSAEKMFDKYCEQ